jgi:NAD(P)-dependent dehydrogenase (short-subunit alcohol dehydrogenase family)
MSGLNDKVVLITGAGKGIGRKLAEALASRGATVALNDISPMNVEEVAAGIVKTAAKPKPMWRILPRRSGRRRW